MLMVTVQVNKDEETAHLLRESTRLKGLKDMDGAIACLMAAKQRMLVSFVSYSIETWCKLARYLRDASQYEKAIAELNWLIEDLPRRAAKELHVDDPNVHYGKGKSKKQLAANMRRYQKKYILLEMARVLERAGRNGARPLVQVQVLEERMGKGLTSQ